MEIYKTSHFREIKKVKCEKVENGKVYFKLCDYNPQFNSERIIDKPINSGQVNYHLTEKEAKNFIKLQLRDNIIKLKFQLEYYNNLLNNF
jgi:hypothetical protein